MTFHQPSVWLLLLLGLVPIWLWWTTRRRARPAVRFSSLTFARTAPRGWGARLRWLVPALRALVLVGLVVALARPRLADERTRVFTEGIAIQLVVDRSGSMEADDFVLERRRARRLDVVKDVVEDFVVGTGDLPGRGSDLVGLVTFASYADALAPLTLDHDHVVRALRQTEVATQREGAGTAIGDAVALGVERLMHLEDRDDLSGRRIKGRVMVLLTDGENNAGDIDPITAASMAATFGIRIYTIGAGSERGTIGVQTDVFGQTVIQQVPVRIDEETLRAIAAETGGRYFRATDTASLQEIYRRIDELERVEIEQQRFTRYTEIAIQPWRMGPVSLPPLLSVVFVLLCVEFALAHTRFRRLP